MAIYKDGSRKVLGDDFQPIIPVSDDPAEAAKQRLLYWENVLPGRQEKLDEAKRSLAACYRQCENDYRFHGPLREDIEATKEAEALVIEAAEEIESCKKTIYEIEEKPKIDEHRRLQESLRDKALPIMEEAKRLLQG
ncbi:hypothetical protein [Botrimarina sp.]|uniref:hypothetical protein n=1 Tax=Botrimarina sp. TaxID=2795802 RepID=UPI0032ECB0CC